jgi:hypothetical protein
MRLQNFNAAPGTYFDPPIINALPRLVEEGRPGLAHAVDA